MKIQKSAEDYLEMMLMLREKLGYIRSIDIAEGLGVSKPSVSYAVKRLREHGYLEMGEDSLLTLTSTGLEIAQRIYHRHLVLTAALKLLGVPEDVARADACRIEHDVSDQTFDALCVYLLRAGVELGGHS